MSTTTAPPLDLALTTKGSWATRAACRPTGRDGLPGPDDPDMFPEEKNVPAVTAAKAACVRCPVRHECLDYAMGAREDGGIWGGLTATERDALRRSAGRTAQRRRQRSAS